MPGHRLIPAALLCAAAAAAGADEIVVLADGHQLDSISTSGAPGIVQTIKGLPDSGRIFAIDTRQSNGVLYGLGKDRLYRLDPASGWATAVGGAFEAPSSPWFGLSMDFDPADDVLRIVVPGLATTTAPFANQVLRLDPDTGLLLDSGSGLTQLAYADGDPGHGSKLRTVCIAHEAADGGGAPALLGVDPNRRVLFRVTSPASGAVTTVAPLTGLTWWLTPWSLEIGPSGAGYVLGVDGNADFVQRLEIFRIDLATAACTQISELPPRPVTDFAIVPTATRLPVRALEMTKAVVRLDFRRPSRNSVEFRGRLPEPLDGWTRKAVRVSVAEGILGTDQINREFVLDRRRRDRRPKDAFSVGAKAKAGLVPFTLRLSREQFWQFFIEESTPSRSVQATLDLLVDGHPFRAVLDLTYAAGKGRGVATLVRRQGD